MRLFARVLITLALLTVTLAPAIAQAPQQTLPKQKQTRLGKYLSAKDAAARIQADPTGTVFIDIRTRGEVQFVGVPDGIDGHVPYVEINEFGEWDGKSNRYKLDVNANFARDVDRLLARKSLGKTAPVILICRSGDRSARAANLLADNGYTDVYSVYEGFEGDMSKAGRRTLNGWKNAGLPWSYKLRKEQAYLSGQ